jgi:hypothetical protein
MSASAADENDISITAVKTSFFIDFSSPGKVLVIITIIAKYRTENAHEFCAYA